MLLASLVDLGADPAALEKTLGGLGLTGWHFEWHQVERCGLRSLLLTVVVDEVTAHRPWSAIRELIEQASLSEWVRSRAISVFERLAVVEAGIHGCETDEVVFHEVGGTDSIVDIVGVILAMELLGVERIIAGPLGVGSGVVDCAHGLIPLPAPATLELVQGWNVHGMEGHGERLTPTGAAIITTLAEQGTVPRMKVLGTGYGAGMRNDLGHPNLVRAVLGELPDSGCLETLIQLSTNIDDMPAEQLAFLQSRLLAEGAIDVWLCPVVMKKGRAGSVLELLAKPKREKALREILLRESSSLGIRRFQVERESLDRWFDKVETGLGAVRIKVGGRGDSPWHAAPEYEDCAALALASGTPLPEIFRLAMRAWENPREE